jgi:hypothetical protein
VNCRNCRLLSFPDITRTSLSSFCSRTSWNRRKKEWKRKFTKTQRILFVQLTDLVSNKAVHEMTWQNELKIFMNWILRFWLQLSDTDFKSSQFSRFWDQTKNFFFGSLDSTCLQASFTIERYLIQKLQCYHIKCTFFHDIFQGFNVFLQTFRLPISDLSSFFNVFYSRYVRFSLIEFLIRESRFDKKKFFVF